MNTPRPHDNTYWVTPGQLLAGEYPGAPTEPAAREKLRSFLDAGVTFFLDLTEEDEPLAPYAHLLQDEADRRGMEVEHCRMPIRDVSVPRSRGQMQAILDTIDRALEDGRRVYVHCWGGIGRTGTVVGCHLVRQGHSGEEALDLLAERWETVAKSKRRPHSPETPEQADYVRTWHEAEPEEGSSTKGPPTREERYRGALLGLAAGDALGTTLEFTKPGTFAPIDDMVGGGPFDLEPGQWTDDTSMALCLATSLTHQGTFDAHDQMARYVRWWREGYLSSTGTCFDIGNTVRAALLHFERTGDPYAGSTDPMSAGNGSLMRLAPVPLFYAHDPGEAIRRAADSSRTTHAVAPAVDACRYMAGLIVGALQGEDKSALLSERYTPIQGLWEREPLCPEIDTLARGSFKKKVEPEVRADGYVVHTLEAALWAFHRTETFREGALMAVNLGEDADTTGAVYGQLAGAFYGERGIPASWRETLTRREHIATLAEHLTQGPA